MLKVSVTMNNERLNRHVKYFPVILFILLVIFKLIFLKDQGPTIFSDELLYKDFSNSIFHLRTYDSVAYPLLYPLVLSISFIFNNDYFFIMNIINILLASAIIFPTWLISRMFIDVKKSVLCCIIVAIIPFQIISSTEIMSENLYFTLLLFTVYFIIKTPKKHISLWSIATGILIGAVHLTRHITIVAVPFFFLILILKFFNKRDGNSIYASKKQKIFHLLLTLFSYLLIYSPWLLIGLINHKNIFDIIGFGISGTGTKDYFTLGSFMMWCCLYLSYALLTAGPVLGLVLTKIFTGLKKPFNDTVNLVLLSMLAIAGSFGFAAVRHSWRQSYNYPEPAYVLGRYITFVSVLFIICAFIAADYIIKNNKINKIKILIINMASILLLLLAYFALIKASFWKLSSYFVLYHIAPDAYVYSISGVSYFIYVLGFVSLSVISMLFKKKHLILLLSCGLLGFYVWGDINYYPNIVKVESQAIHAREVSKLIEEDPNSYNSNNKITLLLDEKDSFPTDFELSLKFWDVDTNKMTIKKINTDNNSLIGDKGYLITSSDLLKHDTSIRKYLVQDKEFCVYKLPIKKDQIGFDLTGEYSKSLLKLDNIIDIKNVHKNNGYVSFTNNSYIKLSESAIDYSNNLSISMKIRIPQYPKLTYSFVKKFNTWGKDISFTFDINKDNLFAVFSPDGRIIDGLWLNRDIIKTNRWYDVKITFDNGNCKFYLDGVVVKEKKLNFSTIFSANQPITIGDALNGDIKEFSINNIVK